MMLRDVTVLSAGVYYISDKTSDYCNTFDASLKVTAT